MNKETTPPNPLPLNLNYAVRARRFDHDDEQEYFPTPPWATRALCEFLMSRQSGLRLPLTRMSVWEPAAGEGHMVRPLTEYFSQVFATDLYADRYAFPYPANTDFLNDAANTPSTRDALVDMVITNPPFKKFAEFTMKALDQHAKIGVAMFGRSVITEGERRYTSIFEDRPPTHVYNFTQRVPLAKGKCNRKQTTATSYSWLIWLRPHPNFLAKQTSFVFSGLVRDALIKDGDYDDDVVTSTPAI